MSIPAPQILPFIPLFYAVSTFFLVLGRSLGAKKRAAESESLRQKSA